MSQIYQIKGVILNYHFGKKALKIEARTKKNE